MARKTKQIPRRTWTEKEIATLRKMAPTRPIGIVAYELGRTEASVRMKALEQKISFGSPERSPYGKPAESAKRRPAARKK